MKLPDFIKKIDAGHAKIVAEGAFTFLSLASLVIFGVYAYEIEGTGARTLTAGAVISELVVNPGNLEAKAAVVYDAKTNKILFEKNANTALALASLTKLMTAEAILATESEDTRITITNADLAPEGDSGLLVGEVWTLKSLLTFGLVASSNDAMAAAASSGGIENTIEKMNSLAQVFNLSSMHFANPTGLDISSTTAGAYGSARDMALLVTDFLRQYPALFSTTVTDITKIKAGGKNVDANPTAEPILDIPGLIGAKTGYTDLAGGNLVAAFDIEVGHPIVVVVLGSSREGRFTDMRNLIDAARAALAKN